VFREYSLNDIDYVIARTPGVTDVNEITVAVDSIVFIGLGSINSFQAIVPLTGQEKGVLFLRGHISLKTWSFRPLLRDSTSHFKSTCLLIRLTGFKL
jgi:hypothetical protein